MKRFFRTPFFIRLFHWEYWNSRVVYLPLYPYWLWLSIKARSFFFLTAANPGIRNGGFIMESKKQVYDILPDGSYPATLYVESGTPTEIIERQIADAGLSFPLVAKPDHGERGLGVKKIHTTSDLHEYAAKMPIPFLVQEYIPYENEVGIFYYRMPWEENGHISGIVNKEPVAVIGDGVKTIADLVYAEQRYILQWEQIKKVYTGNLNTVLDKGQKLVLIPYGNHSRGSKFTDVSAQISPSLLRTIDGICRHIPGFYFGRLDVRFNTWEELEQGKNFSIIELNGSGSEPTHIYDPAHSLFFAWKEILKHWDIMYRISKYNNSNGARYVTLFEGRKEVDAFRKIDALLSARIW